MVPDSSERRANDRSTTIVVVIVILLVLLRAAVLLLTPGSFQADPDGYRQLAQNVLEHGTLGLGNVPTAYRPPLYPLVLVPCVALGSWSHLAIGLLHLAIGAATIWLTCRLGQRWGLGRYSLLAALLVACDPILLNQSTQVMTETLAALLAVMAILLLTHAAERPSMGRVTLAGASVGLAILCRPTFLNWAVLAGILLPVVANVHGLRRRLTILAGFAVVTVLVVAPWAVRNYRQFGRPIAATTHGGYTLLLGNNPSFYHYLRVGHWGTLWNADEFNRQWAAGAPRSGPAAERENDRRAYDEAWRTIGENRRTFLYACLVRVGRLWQPLPHQVNREETFLGRLLRYTAGGWYTVELLLAVLGIVIVWRNKRNTARSARSSSSPSRSSKADGQGELSRTPVRTWLWGMSLAVSLTFVHTCYWSNMRMRAPLMPVVALASVAGWAWLREGRVQRNSLRAKPFDV
jgi:4-amino-4-deoxy-L-arabinose transferase-like glycosyltransferase